MANVFTLRFEILGYKIAALFFKRLFGRSEGGWFLSLAVAVSAVGNVMVVTFALVRSPLHHGALTCGELTGIGTSQPRDRPPGIPPLWRTPLLHETIRRTARWTDRALHPVNHCYLHPREKHLLVHPGRRGMPRTVLLTGDCVWLDLVALGAIRSQAAVQGVSTGRLL